MLEYLLAFAKFIAAWLSSMIALYLYASICILAGFSMPMVLILASCVSVSVWVMMAWIFS